MRFQKIKNKTWQTSDTNRIDMKPARKINGLAREESLEDIKL